MPADVAVLIVAYNSEDCIDACLKSLKPSTEKFRQQVIVVDNASPDGSAAVVEKLHPEVTLVRSMKNLGFSGGVNLAASHADAEFILLLNPDTEVRQNAIEKIVKFAREHPKNGVYGGRTLRPDGGLEPSSCWGLPSHWSLFTFATGLSTAFKGSDLFDPESLGTWKRDSVREVGIVTGCFLLVSTKVWKELRGLDEAYFMYGEDADFAARARALGYRPIIFPEAQVVHEVGKSSRLPIHKALLLYRGKATLMGRLWTGTGRWWAMTLLKAGVGLRGYLDTIRGRRRESVWRELWDRRDEWVGGYVCKRENA